jgi:hypothetical protein
MIVILFEGERLDLVEDCLREGLACAWESLEGMR